MLWKPSVPKHGSPTARTHKTSFLDTFAILLIAWLNNGPGFRLVIACGTAAPLTLSRSRTQVPTVSWQPRLSRCMSTTCDIPRWDASNQNVVSIRRCLCAPLVCRSNCFGPGSTKDTTGLSSLRHRHRPLLRPSVRAVPQMTLDPLLINLSTMTFKSRIETYNK